MKAVRAHHIDGCLHHCFRHNALAAALLARLVHLDGLQRHRAAAAACAPPGTMEASSGKTGMATLAFHTSAQWQCCAHCPMDMTMFHVLRNARLLRCFCRYAARKGLPGRRAVVPTTCCQTGRLWRRSPAYRHTQQTVPPPGAASPASCTVAAVADGLAAGVPWRREPGRQQRFSKPAQSARPGLAGAAGRS